MVRSPNSLGIRGGGSGLSFAVTGNDYDKLVSGASELIAAMTADPMFANAQLSSDDTSPQISVDIDRDRALELGITPDTIADTISAMTQGLTATSVFIDGEETDLLMKPGGTPINDPSDLEQIFARTTDGNIIPLSSVVHLRAGAQSGVLRSRKRIPCGWHSRQPCHRCQSSGNRFPG